MDKALKLLGILCILGLLASCAANIENSKGKPEGEKDATTQEAGTKATTKACGHKEGESGEHKKRCSSWKDPETINPYCPKIGDFLAIDFEELEKTAWDAYKAKDDEKAAKYYLAYVKHNVTDERNIYNLACCFGLLERPALAAKYLERAYEKGFTDINWIKEDPYFEKVRENETFASVMVKIEKDAAIKKAEVGELHYVKSESFFRCYVKLPKDYEEDRPYTLVVGLHGYGSSPESFSGLYNRFENPDFIFAAPLAPYPFIKGSGYSWGPHDYLNPIWNESNILTADYIADVIEYMKKEYKIGDIYLLGFSQGGQFTYKAGIRNHRLLKGIIACGAPFQRRWFERLGASLEDANHLRVLIAHGTEDMMVNFEEGKRAKEELTELGYDVTFHEFEGGHTIPDEALEKIQTWLEEK